MKPAATLPALLALASVCLPGGPVRADVIGIASWYGPELHGRRTASGERFDRNGLTAAHRSHPFGTRLKVTNLANGQSVVVRINDRGPFTRGRIVDVSEAAARRIGLLGRGTARVSVSRVSRGD